MSIFSIFTLLGGLAFFIYGMNQMSHSLERIAGNKMEQFIKKMTESRLSGLIMGCIITVAIQSSSAVTVMLVGLVNSGLMNIGNTVAVIMGSNIGTTITAWLMSLVGISSDNVVIKMLKPESFSPLLAFIGIGLIMLSKQARKKDIGNSFIGFAILMYGMLQAISMTGSLSYGAAIPIIMGQNIGTCATAILSSIGVSKNAKKVAVIHLSFNLIGTLFFMALYFGLHIIFDFGFVDKPINPMGIALCHSIFNIATTVLLLPFSDQLIMIASKAIKTEPERKIAFLDDRLFERPSVAIAECEKLSYEMADLSKTSVDEIVNKLFGYSVELDEHIAELEKMVDKYEDRLGSYLMRFSGKELSVGDSRTVSKILHTIGDFERISDHALNLTESAREISEKRVVMSDSAMKELDKLGKAVEEIVQKTIGAYISSDVTIAMEIEPLEQVIDLYTEVIRQNHVGRLQKGECTIERGFVLADILNNYERISDHCSNIAIAVIEADSDVYDPHEYISKLREKDNLQFEKMYNTFRQKYMV